MFEITFSPVFLTAVMLFLFLHSISIIMSYGMIYAYLQRRNLFYARRRYIKHMIYSALYSLGGVVTLFVVITETSFPQYGFKLIPFEHRRWSGKWKLREMEHLNEGKDMRREAMRMSNRTGGRCSSIW